MTFEQFVEHWTGHDIEFHQRARTTGLEFARAAWEQAMRLNSPHVREALVEIRDRLADHPAYAPLDEVQEMQIGGDTAEFSYLVRIADVALMTYD